MPIDSMPASRPMRRVDIVLAVLFVALLIAAMLLPAIRQDPAYHRFADQRTWLGVPSAANVLSNLAFVAVGLFGGLRLRSLPREQMTRMSVASLWCVAVGFVLTGLGSAWYHAHPDDASLVWDRLPMTFVLAGVLAAALAVRVDDRVARVGLVALVVTGAVSVFYWRETGNLTPYGVFQFGGIAGLVALLFATPADHDPFPWVSIVGWYAFAKLAELGDAQIWHWSSGIVAGHTVKHLAAAATGLALFSALRTR